MEGLCIVTGRSPILQNTQQEQKVRPQTIDWRQSTPEDTLGIISVNPLWLVPKRKKGLTFYVDRGVFVVAATDLLKGHHYHRGLQVSWLSQLVRKTEVQPTSCKLDRTVLLLSLEGHLPLAYPQVLQYDLGE